jgi:hypothetical protein
MLAACMRLAGMLRSNTKHNHEIVPFSYSSACIEQYKQCCPASVPDSTT